MCGCGGGGKGHDQCMLHQRNGVRESMRMKGRPFVLIDSQHTRCPDATCNDPVSILPSSQAGTGRRGTLQPSKPLTAPAVVPAAAAAPFASPHSLLPLPLPPPPPLLPLTLPLLLCCCLRSLPLLPPPPPLPPPPLLLLLPLLLLPMLLPLLRWTTQRWLRWPRRSGTCWLMRPTLSLLR